MRRKLLCAFLASLLVCSCAQASITNETVEAAWARIAKADGFKAVKINYEKDDSPNAWVNFKSETNYSVHVTAGLMKILNSEEEIAGVLGHEIGHVRLGHYKKGVSRNVGWALLGAALGRIDGVAGTVAQAAGSVGMNLAESGFSRGQEVEADDYGVTLLKKAGYDPKGLYRAMKAFADNKYVTQPNGFNSHPPTARRLKHLMDKAKEVGSK
ncbi:MAG: M48 family metalloprotease [Synergistaceae bacterium]|nr:M48 family metalloprotease [Synergistaceae bacterium]